MSHSFAAIAAIAMLFRKGCVRQTLGRRLASSFSVGARKRSWSLGVRDNEFDRPWFGTAEELQQSNLLPPGAKLTAMPYAYYKQPGMPSDPCEVSYSIESARKFSFFESHEDWWIYINECERAGKHQLFNEVLESSSPRCLYFDLDGPPCYKGNHSFIVELLQKFVRSFFLGDKLGWQDFDPQPVVLQSHQKEKYSCHVMFPQIQFDDYRHQNQYMSWILRSLGKVVVDVEGGQERLLRRLVDRAPYRSFQLLRGPFACKLKNKEVVRSSKFEPEEYFDNDVLTCFAGYVQKAHALPIPSMEEILQSNQELLEMDRDEEDVRSKDNPALFADQFQQRHHSDSLDLAGLTELEQYEVLLQYLGDGRADDWCSWWYISGITCSMFRSFNHCDEAKKRIWEAHCRWSSRSFKFDETENWLRITEADQAPHLPTLRSLKRLVEHDHPLMKVRDKLWTFHMPKRAAEGQLPSV